MRPRALFILPLAVLLPAAAATSPVLVRVGERPFTVGQVEALLQTVPPARITAGASAAEVLRDLVVPELLWRHHASLQDVQHGALRDRALARAMQAHLAASVTVPQAEIARFYEQHIAHFVQPEAISVWRIVTNSEESAREVLQAVRGQPRGIEIWSKLARDRSLDTATKMRRGDLGFVEPNGHTRVPEVRVNPAVYDLASKLEDGQLAEHPLEDGEYHSAIWRRGSLPARARSLDEARDEIESVLRGRRGEQALEALLARLRQQHVGDYHPEALESVEWAFPASPNRRRPLAPRPAEGAPAPTAQPEGDR